jgi:serine/threonine protein kinase
MSLKNLERVKELADALMKRPPYERDALLSVLCDGDAELRLEIEGLINAHQQASGSSETLQITQPSIGADSSPTTRGDPATEVEEQGFIIPIHHEPERSQLGVASVQPPSGFIGYKLGERYLIERELGRGAIGVVYLARDKELHNKRVAVKVLLETTDDWLRKKFGQELEALTRINHPGIVAVLDKGHLRNGRPYIVMEFVEGVTLRSVVDSGQMSLERVALIVWRVAQALDAAHSRGVIHRDLKPENVMLQNLGGGEEMVKLIDFGIATVKESLIAKGSNVTQVAGTLPYMASEQLAGQPTEFSDIYALGVIAYEMVTGQVPFAARQPVQLHRLQEQGVRVTPSALRSDLPIQANDVILKALAFRPDERYPSAREFGRELAKVLTGGVIPTIPLPAAPTPPNNFNRLTVQAVEPSLAGLRIALLYKREVQPDEQVLKLLETQFAAKGCQVFIDRHLAIGVEWAKEIEHQVRTSDIVVPLLSVLSVTSEMLAYEVQIAFEAFQQQGKPRILPIRVNFTGPLPEPLASILNPIQYALWRGPQDDNHLVSDILSSSNATTQINDETRKPKFEGETGAVPLDSAFYIVRPADNEFQAAIVRRDSIVLVKGARQMGKTSLLARGLQQARLAGSKVVITDFQMLNATHLASVESFFITLAESIADQLDLDFDVARHWNSRRGPSLNFSSFMRREVLSKLPTHLVWGMDEVDRLFSCDFGSEVFGLFRSWHNARSLDPTAPWQRLTLAIAYATEAHLFITDINQSPFNVGTRLTLDDFTLEQVTELNRRHGSPLRDRAEVEHFCRLVGGQPYLVRRGLRQLASTGQSLAAFEAKAAGDEGPLGDHLRRILVLLAPKAGLCEVVRGVLRGQSCPTAESFYRLRGAGILAGDSAQEVRLRCQLYETYLRRHLL